MEGSAALLGGVLSVLTGLLTWLMMSLLQTLSHRYLGHSPLGGKFYRNHIAFHHAYYSRAALVSEQYLGKEGNNTPYFLLPVGLVGLIVYLILPIALVAVQITTMSVSFYAHVYLDKQYHVKQSWLNRFAWFKRKQERHFAHHLHAACNYAVVDNFWDMLFGTYRRSAELTSKAGYRSPGHEL
jgi:sterol desaturase/sphingolipid hydroxylase (fatty acid hydroxylase superfamily)